MVTTYESFDEAKASLTLDDDGQPRDKVCGTLYDSGQPVYFTMPVGASEPAVRDVAFQIRHGRPVSGYERWLIQAAEEQAAGVPAPSLEVSLANAD